MNPEHWLRTSMAGMSVRPSSRSRNTPLPGSKWSGVQVQYTMQSRSEGWSEARASAFSVAARARLAPVSPSETQCRVRMPERCVIHSSDVSIIRDSSSLVTTRSGTWNAVAMNSVCGIAVPCGRRSIGQDFAPGPPKQGSHGSRSHPRAVRGRAGEGAGGDYVLHLTYEEATALNELCAWNVHTDPSGAVTPESRVFDDLVKAILTHPDY